MRVFFMRHIIGDSRRIAEDHPIRVIDAFVDTLVMKALAFSKAETRVAGRKSYHPGDHGADRA